MTDHKPEHSPPDAMPWFAEKKKGGIGARILNQELELVAECSEYDADYIVKAANAYPALLERNRLLEGLLWYAWNEMNIIRARDGVPRDYTGSQVSVSEKFWSDMVDAMADALGDDAKPWPSEAARAALAQEK